MSQNTFLDYYLSKTGRAFLIEQSVLLAVAASALLAVFGGDLDLAVARLFFDAALGKFPGTNDWWLKSVLHDDARGAATLALLALIATTAAAWWLPRPRRLREARHALTFVMAAAIAAAITVTGAKHLSSHACPWDIVDFGGIAPYRHLFERHGPLPPVAGCFPAAHPLVGFGWLGAAFALRPFTRRWAKLSALLSLATGAAFGFIQMARGAHFLSHVLWTAWTAWAANLTLLWMYRRFGTRSANESRCAADRAPVRLPARRAPQPCCSGTNDRARRDRLFAGARSYGQNRAAISSMRSIAVDRSLAASPARGSTRP